MNRLITLALAIVSTVTFAASPSAAQESYPNKSITMITPEVVGSAADLLSRPALYWALAAVFGLRVIVLSIVNHDRPVGLHLDDSRPHRRLGWPVHVPE